MDAWLDVVAAFVGGVIITVLGNLIIPLCLEHRRRPKLKIELRDDSVLAQNKQVIYHRLQVINEGKTVAPGCVATIKIKNATKENVLEDEEWRPILKSDNFGVRAVLENSQFLCWSFGGNPSVLALNPDVPYTVDVLAFDYGQIVDPKSAPAVQRVIIPSEMGWKPPRVVLKPGRYVIWVRVSGENCKPSNEVRFWVRRIGGADDDHLEVSFTP